MTSFGNNIAIKRIPNKMDTVFVKFLKVDHTAKRHFGGITPNCGR
jgi:hypothetical protein